MSQMRLYPQRLTPVKEIVRERLAGLELRQRERDRRRGKRSRGKSPQPAAPLQIILPGLLQ
jgi:hypothetical protein